MRKFALSFIISWIFVGFSFAQDFVLGTAECDMRPLSSDSLGEAPYHHQHVVGQTVSRWVLEAPSSAVLVLYAQPGVFAVPGTFNLLPQHTHMVDIVAVQDLVPTVGGDGRIYQPTGLNAPPPGFFLAVQPILFSGEFSGQPFRVGPATDVEIL